MQQLHRELHISEVDANLPPALRARILEQLGNAVAQAPPPAEPARPWLLRYGFATSLAVNAALIVVLVYAGLLREHRSDQPTPVAVTVPVVSPQPAQPTQNGSVKTQVGGRHPAGDGSALKASKMRSAVAKPAMPPPHSPVSAPPANNGLAPMPVPSALPAPKMSTPQKAQTQPFSAGSAAPETYDAAPPLSAQRQNGRARAKTPPALSAPAPVVTDAPASPAPPPAAFGGVSGGFGGSSFGGGGAPPVREAVPGSNAPGAVGRVVPPPPAQALTAPVQAPAADRIEQRDTADSNGTAAAKPAPSSAKTRVEDRATPSPVGAWPTVTLPFGVEPSALGVKSVVVTWDVDDQGRPSHVRFITTGNTSVDGALRAAVYAGQYQPAIHNGKPVKASLTHTFVLSAGPHPAEVR